MLNICFVSSCCKAKKKKAKKQEEARKDVRNSDVT